MSKTKECKFTPRLKPGAFGPTVAGGPDEGDLSHP